MIKKRKTKTYNSRDSLVVTHPTTNRPACDLSTAERTGSPVLHTLWSYVIIFNTILIYMVQMIDVEVHSLSVGVNRADQTMERWVAFRINKGSYYGITAKSKKRMPIEGPNVENSFC